MKAWIFTKRNFKELSRDPLSYVFCVALPVIMLIVMYAIFYDSNTAIWFALNRLTPGIMCFSYAFTMLYMALLVSKDRCTAFLQRLFTSPMKTVDFVAGYALPGVFIALAQGLACLLTGYIMSLINGEALNLLHLLLMLPAQLPLIFVFVALGILFGTLFSDKAAPGLCSAIITISGFMSGAWMPVEMYKQTAPAFYHICRALPFYPVTAASRAVLLVSGTSSSDILFGVAISLAYALVLCAAAVMAFKRKSVL